MTFSLHSLQLNRLLYVAQSHFCEMVSYINLISNRLTYFYVIDSFTCKIVTLPAFGIITVKQLLTDQMLRRALCYPISSCRKNSLTGDIILNPSNHLVSVHTDSPPSQITPKKCLASGQERIGKIANLDSINNRHQLVGRIFFH